MAKKMLVDGKWIASEIHKPVLNPYSNEIVDDVYWASAEIIEKAMMAAQKGFGLYKALRTYERVNILRKIFEGISDKKDLFIRTIVAESGKPIHEAIVEVERAIVTFKLASAEAERIHGELIPLDIHKRAGRRIGLIKHFPIGPVLAITPFNFPLNLVAHKVAPALAAGCSVVLKPSSSTPLTALLLGEVIQESGIPDGVVNILPCGVENAEKMVKDPRIKMVTFTGSAAVGWKLKAISGKKRITLELGGNAAAIVEPDVDLVFCSDRCLKGGYAYSGQVCISLQRIFIHKSIYESFKTVFVEKVKQLKLGNPMDENIQIGPMITEKEADRVLAWIREAEKMDAKILAGGVKKGSFIQPTVLENVPVSAKLSREEVFGPVTILFSYSSLDEAISAANDSRFGLQVGVFSNNWSAIWKVFNEMEVGGVIVNDVPTIRVDNYPYGGVKDSGMGREGVRYALEEMLEKKTLVLPG